MVIFWEGDFVHTFDIRRSNVLCGYGHVHVYRCKMHIFIYINVLKYNILENWLCFKNSLKYLEQLRSTSKSRGRERAPIYPDLTCPQPGLPHYHPPPARYVRYNQWTYLPPCYHPKSVAYTRFHFWCCIFHVFWQLYNDVYPPLLLSYGVFLVP